MEREPSLKEARARVIEVLRGATGGAASDQGQAEEAKEGEAAAAASSSARARSAAMERTGLTLPSIVVKEIVDAAKREKLERLQARCRMWEEAHPDAPACFGTDAWVPALWTAAHDAASAGRTRVLRWLVEERGVPVHCLTLEEKALLLNDPEAAEPYETPVFLAVEREHETTALYLLRAGLQQGTIDAKHDSDEEKVTVLHVGAMRGISAELMAALVEEGGFDPTTPCCISEGEGETENETPLAIAAKAGYVHLVDYFLRWARREGLINEAKYYCLDKEKKAVTLTWAAIRNRQLAVVKHLVESVEELNLSDEYYFLGANDSICCENPVFGAATMADLPILRFLLAPERAADRGLYPIDKTDRMGFTLLNAAVAVRSKEKPRADVAAVVEFLLERGADPTIADAKGVLPATHARRLGFADVARLLEEAASKGAKAEAARAAEAELLRLLEEEEAAAPGQTQQGGGGGSSSKKQKKKGKSKAKKGEGGVQAGTAAAAQEQEQEPDRAAAAMAALSVDGADGGGGNDAQQLSEEDAFILARARDEAPDFVCPLLGRIMERVALASDGYSYEWSAIEAHIERCQAAGRVPDSPKTSEPIDPALMPNRILRCLIDAFVDVQRRAFAAQG